MKAALLLTALLAAPASAALTQRELDSAVARPPAGATLPAALGFVDRSGRRVTLGQVAGGRPTVLLFADYTCRHVCGPGLALTAGALADTRLVAGRDYALAVIGLDPHDPVAAAGAMADAVGAPAFMRHAALLTGTPAIVAAATRALGYHAVYDPATDQFAHDAAVYVFARDGRLAALLPELALRPESLRAALTAPSATASLGLADRVAHLCWGLGAIQGRYARPAVLALQGLSVTLLAGAAALLWRRRRATAGAA